MVDGDVAVGAGAPEDVRNKDTGADSGGDGVLLDDTASTHWPRELASSRHDILQGCLWPAVFFLIFATRLGNEGCRFITSRTD
jgi:hypothetical protein